jgi:hypothetical protein
VAAVLDLSMLRAYGSYEVLELQTVNEHGLLYTWQGSESHLRPLLFMAHSDVSATPYSTMTSPTEFLL